MASSVGEGGEAIDAGNVHLTFKWKGQVATVSMQPDDSIADLKDRLCEEWGVLPKRQKLIGIKPSADETLLTDTKHKRGATLMMLGALEEELKAKLGEPEDLPEVVNDLDWEEEVLRVQDHPHNLAKIARRVSSYEIKMHADTRPGKKLLVLDIDYTVYDHRSPAENFEQLTRPHLHNFLASAYESFDIAFWSATGMKWIDVKLTEMGLMAAEGFKIAFCLDSRAMITVNSPTYGVVEVKPLAVIWGKFPGAYGPHNTIMFDDLRRNFLMNPRNGLRIRACRQLPLNAADDHELRDLARYLQAIAPLEGDAFSALDHKKWRKYAKRHAPGVEEY